MVKAWTEPSQAPPGGNAPAPINVGGTSQIKTGELTFPRLVDYNDTSYYLDPNGSSRLKNLDMAGNRINSVADPSVSSDAATRGWVEAQIAAAGGGGEGISTQRTGNKGSGNFWTAGVTCRDASDNGKTDWRLPTVDEALSWASDSGLGSNWYWTTTPCEACTEDYPYLHLVRAGWPIGLGSKYDWQGGYNIFCVRP